mmetsp:Transcript_1565/g.4550  ORF Transcript_1565/g.4550 Transcript_1565/m.4550 type:complete len:272 (-) Transcript_1565:922-1737(-)
MYLGDCPGIDLFQHGAVEGLDALGSGLPGQLNLGLELFVHGMTPSLERDRRILEDHLRASSGSIVLPNPSIGRREGRNRPAGTNPLELGRIEFGWERPPHQPAVHPLEISDRIVNALGPDHGKAQMHLRLHHGISQSRPRAVGKIGDLFGLHQIQHLMRPCGRIFQTESLLLKSRTEQTRSKVLQRLALDDRPQYHLDGLLLRGAAQSQAGTGGDALPLPAGDPQHVADGELADLGVDAAHEELGLHVIGLLFAPVYQQNYAPITVLVEGG